jgi:PepSY-associated TM region
VYRLAGSAPPPPGRLPGPKVEAPPAGTARVPVESLVAEAMRRVPGWRELSVRFDPAGGAGRPAAVMILVKEEGAWPLFASVQLWADPFSGQVLREERFADQSPGRKVRTWLRFLHTGEALGRPGQVVAGTASLGAALLVWTGLALALRRLLRSWRSRERTDRERSSGPETSPL